MPMNKDGTYEAPELHPPGPRQVEAPPEVKPIVVEVKPDTEIQSSMVKTLEAMNARQQRESSAAQFLADPQIRQYWEAKNRGQNARLVVDDEPTVKSTIEPPPTPEDFDKLTNAQVIEYAQKSLLPQIETLIQKYVGAETKRVREELEPQLNGLLTDAQSRMARDAKSQVDSVAKEFKDFEAMKPLIADINAAFAGAANPPSLREMYYLAKIRAGQPLTSQKEIETEKPSGPTADRTQTSGYRRPEKIHGKGGFTAILAAHLATKTPGFQSQE